MPNLTVPLTTPLGVRFQLRSLLLVTAWLAVVFAVLGALPVLGMVAAVLTMPALARTRRYALSSEAVGETASAGELADTFLFSLILLVALGGAWLLVALFALGVAVLATTIMAAVVCRLLAIAMVHASRPARAVLRFAMQSTIRQVTCLGRELTNRPTAYRGGAAVATLLPGTLFCACFAAFVLVAAVVAIVAFVLMQAIVYTAHGLRRVDRHLRGGHEHLLGWKQRLVRDFAEPHKLVGELAGNGHDAGLPS